MEIIYYILKLIIPCKDARLFSIFKLLSESHLGAYCIDLAQIICENASSRLNKDTLKITKDQPKIMPKYTAHIFSVRTSIITRRRVSSVTLVSGLQILIYYPYTNLVLSYFYFYLNNSSEISKILWKLLTVKVNIKHGFE